MMDIKKANDTLSGIDYLRNPIVRYIDSVIIFHKYAIADQCDQRAMALAFVDGWYSVHDVITQRPNQHSLFWQQGRRCGFKHFYNNG